MTNIDIKNLYDKYLFITTTNGSKYKIEKKNIYINDSSSFYGDRYILKSDKDNKDLYILHEIYSLEDNRLRFCYEVYKNVKLVTTIEKDEDNNERNILVVETYDNNSKQVLIGSIGNIARIDSDKIDELNTKKNNGILRLVLKPKDKENLLAA